MPKYIINLSQEQRQILEEHKIDIADFLRVALKAKIQDMVAGPHGESVPKMVNARLRRPYLKDFHDPWTEKFTKLKNQGKITFLNFDKGEWTPGIKGIIRDQIIADDTSVTITAAQENFLLCDMLNPEEWINNAIQMKANRLIEGTDNL